MGNDIARDDDLLPGFAESCFNLNFINLPLARLIHPFKFIPNAQKFDSSRNDTFHPPSV